VCVCVVDEHVRHGSGCVGELRAGIATSKASEHQAQAYEARERTR